MNAARPLPAATCRCPRYYDLDHGDAETFLRDINFPDAARHLAFEVFARSFFAEPSACRRRELAAMFHIYFLGSSEGLIFDVVNANFDVALWNPLQRYLEGNGVRFHTGLTVDDVSVASDVRVTCGADAGVRGGRSGVGHRRGGPAAHRRGSPGLGDETGARRVADLHTAPPFVVLRLWLDRPVRADRAAFVGTGGRPPLDNVSVLERYEREAAQWAARTGGSVVELHAYSVTDPEDDVRDALVARMHQLYPETVGATDRRRTPVAPCRLSALRRQAISPIGPPSGRRIREWCWRATGFASTCRWH